MSTHKLNQKGGAVYFISFNCLEWGSSHGV
jgi:hypothetical protein